MATIGSLIFCTACGDLLPPTTGDPKRILVCTVCGTQNRGEISAGVTTTPFETHSTVDVKFEPVVTKSKPDAFPSALRAKHSNVQVLNESDVQKEAVIRYTCPECENEEMLYYTQQLRSADEGTTVFYRCPKCNHRYGSDPSIDLPLMIDIVLTLTTNSFRM
jgi:DNA-directed RNA polymerase I subunit RPA12